MIISWRYAAKSNCVNIGSFDIVFLVITLLQLVPFTLSKDQYKQIPGESIPAVPHTANFAARCYA